MKSPSSVSATPVTLLWEGKQEAMRRFDRDAPVAYVEETCSGDARESAVLAHRVIFGDALDVARSLAASGLAGQADVVYLDPPYLSGVDYEHEERLDGTPAGRVARTAAYRDRWDGGPAAYLDMLFPRLVALRALLRETGSIWIQVDWRAHHLARVLCDEVFGRDRFLNEIVWRRAPNLGRQARSGQFGRTLDTLIVYGASSATRLIPPRLLVPVSAAQARKDPATGRLFTVAPRGDYTDASIERLEREGRIHRTSKGAILVKYWLEQDEKGRHCRRQPVDALWTDVPPLRHAKAQERTGYPTQKPCALLSRVIESSSSPGGLVIDLFAGSGTTAVAAARLGRRCVVGDASPVAIAAMRSRLLREGHGHLTVERCGASLPTEDVSIETRPLGAAEMQVVLHSGPTNEPIAWALCRVSDGDGDAFRVDWHAERGTGKRPAALLRTAVLPRAPRVRARVYFVDGKVGTAEALFATHTRGVPMGSQEMAR